MSTPLRAGRVGVVAAALMLLVLSIPAVARPVVLPARGDGTVQYGYVQFPKDEHQHIDGWDYWWGAADLVMKSGNRYTVGIAFDSFDGYGDTGHQIFPRQGPYKGLSIMTADGPTEWGHPGEQPGQFVRKMSVYAPGVSDLLSYQTLDTANGMKDIGRWERTSGKREKYHLRIDNDHAKVHPTGKSVRAVVDLNADMQSPPLLLGGTGRWWYGIPQIYRYPSRSFQYMQAARTLTGTLDLQQPDGSILHEAVVPRPSTLVMVHEYDATPEDLFAGLALAEASQLHPRYAQYYEGGLPWDLIFVDLKNGAQLMLAVLAFHDTGRGTLRPIIAADQPTYQMMATLRLPSGQSIALDDVIHVEHLSYRSIVGRVPTFAVTVDGMWTQDWEYRVSYRGGRVMASDGSRIHVPAFDLGFVPQFKRSEPAVDDRGNRLTQRVPFVAAGAYGGCPVRGFGWSELIINWYGHEASDPWFTGGHLPRVPARCGGSASPPPKATGNLTPSPGVAAPPNFAPEGCSAYNPGPTTKCEYNATVVGGVGGYASGPGGWKVTIKRPGNRDRIVITSFSGEETYGCGTIRRRDHVIVTAQPGSGVTAGNPGICF